jgi:hypothetical protein
MVHSKYIIILGPDGSGKTTLSDKLAEKIKAEKRSVKRINFSFGIMPPISSVLRRKKHKYLPEGETNSGMVVPLPLVISVLLAIWYGIDHLLGHWRLRYTLNQEIVIFARSYHDFLYQRAYLNLPPFIPRLFLALGPKPDLLMTPFRDPQVINENKPELTTVEIARQYEFITKRLGYYSSFAKIDASAGIDPTVAKLYESANL